MADAVIGESNLIAGLADQTYGFFQSLEINEVTEDTELKDADGDIVGVQFHGARIDVSGTYIFRSTSGAPDQQVGSGTAITLTNAGDSDFPLASKDIYIKSAKTVYAPDGFKAVEFEGSHYPSLST